jgi:hypothetical protein
MPAAAARTFAIHGQLRQSPNFLLRQPSPDNGGDGDGVDFCSAPAER